MATLKVSFSRNPLDLQLSLSLHQLNTKPRPYSRDTRETDSLARLFNFQLCASHVATSRVSFSRNPLDLQLSLSFYQLNTKPNTIKSHKIQGKKTFCHEIKST